MTPLPDQRLDRSRLSPQQLAHYREQGYLLFHEPVLPDAEFARLREMFEENLARYGADDLDTMHFRDPRLLEFLLCDHVLDLVEPITGPNIGLWSSHFISKPPFSGKATPWHEDSAYWAGRISTMENVVTVWLALDRVDEENGAMKVVPGTHRAGGQSEYEAVDGEENIFVEQIRTDLVDERQAVAFELEPNQCSLHDSRIVHGAPANTSSRRRAGYTMRYFPTTSRVFPDRNVGHRIWLARGVDLAGNVYANA